MLRKRNDNVRMVDLPLAKLNGPQKIRKTSQKENNPGVNRPFTALHTSKQDRTLLTTIAKKNSLELETEKIRSTYVNKILAFELSRSDASFKPPFLERHAISADVRARMVI